METNNCLVRKAQKQDLSLQSRQQLCEAVMKYSGALSQMLNDNANMLMLSK